MSAEGTLLETRDDIEAAYCEKQRYDEELRTKGLHTSFEVTVKKVWLPGRDRKGRNRKCWGVYLSPAGS